MQDETNDFSMTETEATQVALLFSALSDTSRVRILSALMECEMNVGDLAEIAAISHSAVSHHMRHLRQMRLVKARKVGRHVFYSIDDDHVRDLICRGVDHVRHL